MQLEAAAATAEDGAEGENEGVFENLEDMDEEELDLDYSQTHLDDFLKSHTSSTMLKGTNI